MVGFVSGFVACSGQTTLKHVADYDIYLDELIGVEYAGLSAGFNCLGFDKAPGWDIHGVG